MAIAHAPGMGVFTDYQYVRRAGRSALGETWLVQRAEGPQHAVKLVVGDWELSNYSRLTVHRHPFLMSWDRCEVVNGDLLLSRYWSEETLADYLLSPGQARQGELSRAILLRHLEETAEVLDFLHHKAQMIHGAVKPSNVGLLHNHVKLLDWGLLTCEALRRKAWNLDDLMLVAPEQLRGELLPQSDQYALACIFAKAMTGQPLRGFATLEEYFQVTQQSERPELTFLSADDRQVVSRAWQRDPRARYGSCQEFVRLLIQNPMTPRPEPAAERIVIPEQKTREVLPIVISELNQVKPSIELLASSTPSDPEISSTVIKSFIKAEAKTRHPDSAFLNLNSLVYHSEVTARGVLTPTLIIGLGGEGSAVLRHFVDQLQTKFGGLSNLPNIHLLAVDTDSSSLNEALSPRSASKDQLGLNTQELGLSTFHCRLATPGGYLWKDLGFANYTDSVPPEQIDLLGPQPKTNQRRSLGRLAFLANASSLREKITATCQAMLGSHPLMVATKNTGLPVMQDVIPKVYLLAGLGGASSGALVDVAYLARSILNELGWTQMQITGLAFLPADEDESQIKANAFASLVELDYFTEKVLNPRSLVSSEDYFGLSTKDLESLPPFDEVFFWRSTDTEKDSGHLATSKQLAGDSGEVLSASCKAANWLLRDVMTLLGGLRRASRESMRNSECGIQNEDQSSDIPHSAFGTPHSLSTAKRPKDTNWYSSGFSSLSASRDLLITRGRQAVFAQFIQHWLVPSAEIVDEIQKDGERFLADNGFSIETVLARLEHIAAVVLGREPTELIDEWISPLRKGAAARPPLEVFAQELMHKVELHFGHGEGQQAAPAILAMQQEAETAAQEICARVPLLLKRYLDRPGYRLGATLRLGRMLLAWVTQNLTELQENHSTIAEQVIGAERTLTQMVSQEERAFTIMGRQRQVTQVTQDLIDYPVRIIREDLFARAAGVFQSVKDTLLLWLQKLEPGERSLQELHQSYLDQAASNPLPFRLILDGHRNIDERMKQLLKELPEDAYLKLDLDFSQFLARQQINYADVLLGKESRFRDLLELLTSSVDDLLEEILPPPDAAEQLLQAPSLSVVEQLREAYREARPSVSPVGGSRQGAFCLMISPPSETAKELLQMAQSTLPQIIAAPEGSVQEVLLYRETGPLPISAIYPQGKEAYVESNRSAETSPHSRTDISWQRLSSMKEREPKSDSTESESLGFAVHA